jgi:glycosyltransferase involved in cell wall biosynthesis
VRRSRFGYGRWYSRTLATSLLTSLAARSVNGMLLSVRLMIEHRRRRYDAVFQLSQSELFLLGRLRRWAPPIVVHPCSHAAGELRWHRAEQEYALASERRRMHYTMRAWLKIRARIQRGELARADLVVGPSKRFLALLQQDAGVPAHKLRLLRHPVDLDRFAPAPEPSVEQPHTLLFISRISARKGVEDIIALSHRLADLAGSVRLLVVGGPTLWSDYRAHLRDLHPEVAHYAGGLPSEQVVELLRSASMLLVPSRYEPGSIVTGEALASGLPVVMSDEVGPSEVVSGPHVRVYPAGDVDALEASVRSLLDELERDPAGVRRAARADAEAHFAAADIGAQLRRVLASAGRSGPGAAPAPAPSAGHHATAPGNGAVPAALGG